MGMCWWHGTLLDICHMDSCQVLQDPTCYNQDHTDCSKSGLTEYRDILANWILVSGHPLGSLGHPLGKSSQQRPKYSTMIQMTCKLQCTNARSPWYSTLPWSTTGERAGPIVVSSICFCTVPGPHVNTGDKGGRRISPTQPSYRNSMHHRCKKTFK